MKSSSPGTSEKKASHRRELRARWESVTRWPLVALSVGFLIAYTAIASAPPDSEFEFLAVSIVLAVAWLAFVLDVVVRLTLTPRTERGAYFRANRIDMFSALLPILRPFSMLKYLQYAPGFSGNGGNALRSRVVTIAGAYAALYVYVIAITVLQFERIAPGATIVSFGDAIWWACVTLATVGYGDYVPITVPGRILAVMLMAGGVAIVGTASAVVVSYLSERIRINRPKHDQ